MILFADATASSSEIGNWMIICFLVLNGIGTAILIIKSLRNDPEKREVTVTQDCVTLEVFNTHVSDNKTDINGLHTKIGGSERGTKAELKKDIEDLRIERHRDTERINTELMHIVSQCGELKASNQGQNQRLSQIDAKLDRLIERKHTT